MGKVIKEILKFLFYVTFAIVHGTDIAEKIDMDNVKFKDGDQDL